MSGDTLAFVALVLTDSRKNVEANTGVQLSTRNFMASLYKDQGDGSFSLLVDTWVTKSGVKEEEVTTHKKMFSVPNVDFYAAVSKSHNYRDDWSTHVGDWKNEKS